MLNFRQILLISILVYIINCFEDQQFYNKIHTVKLEGNSTFTYYYVNVYVGSPPQRQTLIIDTGSNVMTMPCSDCQNKCGNHIDQPFNIKQSLTNTVITCKDKIGNHQCNSCDNEGRCKLSISYAEGSSLQGYYIQDYVVLGDEIQKFLDNNDQESKELLKFVNHEKVKMVFGCTTRETNLFLTQKADGIIGLSPATNSTQYFPNLIDELFLQHAENKEQLAFSLCLDHVNGGVMSIGGYSHEHHLKNAQTYIIPYYLQSKYYQIIIKSIIINDIDIGITKFNKPIVDSGSTVMLAPSKTIQAMKTYISKFCQESDLNCLGRQMGNCYHYDQQKYPDIFEFFKSFPIIEFELENDFIFQWKPHNYLFIDTKPDYYCYGFEPYGGDHMILGGTWMHNFDILFDRESSTLHFTESTCDQSKIYNEYIENGYDKVKTTTSDQSYWGSLTNVSASDVLYYVLFLIIGMPVLAMGFIQLYKLCRVFTIKNKNINSIKINKQNFHNIDDQQNVSDENYQQNEKSNKISSQIISINDNNNQEQDDDSENEQEEGQNQPNTQRFQNNNQQEYQNNNLDEDGDQQKENIFQ